MWLGDGLSKGYGFITADKELLDELYESQISEDANANNNYKNNSKYRYRFVRNNN